MTFILVHVIFKENQFYKNKKGIKVLLGKKEYLIFPKKSLIYLLYFFIIISITAFIVDAAVLPFYENKGDIGNSREWTTENKLISDNGYYKINMDYDYRNPKITNDNVWQTKAYTVKREKTTSKRILVVADSFVWGDGYANINDVWWRQLQKELIKRGYYDIEVIATGQNGWSTKDEFRQVKRILKLYNPDIVIWGYVTNDADEGLIKQGNPQDVEQSDRLLKFLARLKRKHSNFLPRLVQQIYETRLNKVTKEHDANLPLNPETVYDYSKWEESILKDNNFEQYKKTVREVASYVKENKDIKFFFITLPNSPNEKFQKKYEKILPLFASNNIKMYNILPEFVKKYSGLMNTNSKIIWGINPVNGHPGVISAKFYAEQIINFLENDYSSCLPVKYSGKIPEQPLINDWMPMNTDINQKDNVLEFEYPSNTDNFLSMPFGYKYFQLNLSYPAKIKKITVQGKNLTSASIDVNYDDIKSFDDLKTYQLGTKIGNDLSWSSEFDKSKPVSAIKLRADFSSDNERKIRLTVIKDGE